MTARWPVGVHVPRSVAYRTAGLEPGRTAARAARAARADHRARAAAGAGPATSPEAAEAADAPEAAVVAVGLVKRFGKTEALRGLDLRAERGTVLGVLGPNGAGKTTAVRVLTTLLAPDAGTARVFGFDVAADPQQVRCRIGLTGQFAAVDELLTAGENLTLIGRLAGMPRRAARARTAELIERFDLAGPAARPARTYSGGQRRRLDIAASLMTAPPLLVLDEPTTGLDPHARIAVWQMVEDLVREGTTVLLTSQYLDEVDRLAHRVTVIDGGRVIAEGTPGELKSRIGDSRLTVTLSPGDTDLARAGAVLLAFGTGEPRTDPATREVSVAVAPRPGLVPAVVRALDEAGADLEDAAVRHATLDDVFLALTGHASRNTDPDEQTSGSQDAPAEGGPR